MRDMGKNTDGHASCQKAYREPAFIAADKRVPVENSWGIATNVGVQRFKKREGGKVSLKVCHGHMCQRNKSYETA